MVPNLYPMRLWCFAVKGNIVWCNKLAQNLLGFRWPDDAGQPINNLLRSPDFGRYLAHQQFEHPIEITSPMNYDRTLELRIVRYTEGEYLMVVRDVSHSNNLKACVVTSLPMFLMNCVLR